MIGSPLDPPLHTTVHTDQSLQYKYWGSNILAGPHLQEKINTISLFVFICILTEALLVQIQRKFCIFHVELWVVGGGVSKTNIIEGEKCKNLSPEQWMVLKSHLQKVNYRKVMEYWYNGQQSTICYH